MQPKDAVAAKDLSLHPQVWRGSALLNSPQTAIPTGFAVLDKHLAGGGWPLGALTEILLSQEGIGELRLLMPALARLSQQERWLAWIAPPYIPYAPALTAGGVDLARVLLIHPRANKDGIWAIEQALRSGTCSAVMVWLAANDQRLQRRLQLAAEAGQSACFLFRNERTALRSSYAALRLRLEAVNEGLKVHILKRRGGWVDAPLILTV